MPRGRPKKINPWDVLRELIGEYADACRADEMKGGGDPADIKMIGLQYLLAQAKLEAHISKMEREAS